MRSARMEIIRETTETVADFFERQRNQAAKNMAELQTRFNSLDPVGQAKIIQGNAYTQPPSTLSSTHARIRNSETFTEPTPDEYLITDDRWEITNETHTVYSDLGRNKFGGRRYRRHIPRL